MTTATDFWPVPCLNGCEEGLRWVWTWDDGRFAATWQHGENPEHRTVITVAEFCDPSEPTPLTLWVNAVHARYVPASDALRNGDGGGV